MRNKLNSKIVSVAFSFIHSQFEHVLFSARQSLMRSNKHGWIKWIAKMNSHLSEDNSAAVRNGDNCIDELIFRAATSRYNP